MTTVKYEVVQHDGGWANKVGSVISETFPTHDKAHAAAASAASRQRVAGVTDGIEYEDSKGEWHQEVADGSDRPDTVVEDKA